MSGSTALTTPAGSGCCRETCGCSGRPGWAPPLLARASGMMRPALLRVGGMKPPTGVPLRASSGAMIRPACGEMPISCVAVAKRCSSGSTAATLR